MLNARQGWASWNVGRAGALMFEVGRRAFVDLEAERQRGSGTAYRAIVERAVRARTGRRAP